MVDVTADNFSSLRPQIEAELRSALFVAVDTEFTCLLSDERFSNQWFDNGDDRYKKLRQNLDKVAINQLGLAIYTPVPDSNQYECRAYNIYVRPTSFMAHDSTMLCQASSLDFLARHNYDFNTWLYSGVSHLSRQDLAVVEGSLAALRAGTYTGRLSFEATDHIRDILDWSDDAALGDQYTVPGDDGGPHTCYADLSLAPVLLATLHNTCPDLHAAVGAGGKIEVRKLTPADREALEPTIEQEWRELTAACLDCLSGCSHLMWLLAKLKKPVVFHNGLLDLVLLYKQFFNDVPVILSEFKDSMLQEFPVIYDTKCIAFTLRRDYRDNKQASDSLRMTGLYELAVSMRQSQVTLFKPVVELVPRQGKYDVMELRHEAGYDAYLTGYCYLQMAHLAFTLAMPSCIHSRPLEPREHMTAVKHIANKMNVMRAAIQYMNLSGPDPDSLHPPWIIVEKLWIRRPVKQVAAEEIKGKDNGITVGDEVRRDCSQIRTVDSSDTDTLPGKEIETRLGNSLNSEKLNNENSVESNIQQNALNDKVSQAYCGEGSNVGTKSALDVNANLLDKSEPLAKEVSESLDKNMPKALENNVSVATARKTRNRLRQQKQPPPTVLHTFTPEAVAALLSRFGPVDVRPWRLNKMLVAAPSFDTHKSILSGLNVSNLKVYQYNPYRHSWLARSAMWSGLLAGGGVCAYLLYSCLKKNN